MTFHPPAMHERPEAGTHLIADFWDVRPVDSVDALERALRAAVDAAGATLLDLSLHQFPGDAGEQGGITGYAMLAESHISVHTWPERDYVAIDVFMCGEQRPYDSLDVLRTAFQPASETVRVVRRGLRPSTDASSPKGTSAADAAGSGALANTAVLAPRTGD